VKESCATCRFYIGQSCRRHAPVYMAGSFGPHHPQIIEGIFHWCGDYEDNVYHTDVQEKLRQGDDDGG